MKLLIYSHSFAPNVGGVETIVLSLARGLADLRGQDGKPTFELTLVTQTPPGEDCEERALGFPVIRQPGVLQLWRLIRAADVIHLAGPALMPLILARVAGKPVVIEHHGYQAICPNGLLVELPERKICPGYFQAREYSKCVKCQASEMSWLQAAGSVVAMFPRNYLARRAARNIAISKHQGKRMALPSSLLIYHGVEEVSDADAALPGGPATDGKICFAYVGRFVPEKGLGTLLEAVELLKKQEVEFQLLLIGDGPERGKLQERIARSGLGDVVRCTGFLKGAEFAEITKSVHVFLMPSSWEETAGLAAIEQMMRGNLVMAARIGGLGEIVGSAGITLEAGHADEIARAMEKVLSDPKTIPTLGAKARERAREIFVRERMIAEHAQLYGDIFHNETVS